MGGWGGGQGSCEDKNRVDRGAGGPAGLRLAGRGSPTPGLCRQALWGLLLGKKGAQRSKGAGWAQGQALARPLSHTPQPSSMPDMEARASAGLFGPSGWEQLARPQGRPPFPAWAEEETGEQR